MKKILIITAIIATGLSVQAQTLVLSDDFTTDTGGGGVTTNDLNFNLAGRQAGTAATKTISATTNAISHTLTDTGKLHMKGTTELFDGIATDSFGPEIGSDSFRVKWKMQHNVDANSWSMMSILSDGNFDWNNSPMSVNVWHSDFIHLMYGSFTNIAPSNDLLVDMSPTMVNNAIGGIYDANDLHEFEIRANASTSSNGTYSCTMDGILLAAGLPYAFEDAAKKMSWYANAGPSPDNGTDALWDDLDISTIPAVPAKEYVFFDNFNGPDGTDANWLYGARQTNGIVVQPYTLSTPVFSITNNKLHEYTGAAAQLQQPVDMSSHIVGEDFEFSFKVTVPDTSDQWSSIYLYDETGDPRGDSRMGCLIWGQGHGFAFSLYSGAGGAQENPFPSGVTVAQLTTAMGSAYDKSVEHTIKFVSTAGADETNTYDFVVDGFTILSNVVYRFDGDQRKIGMIGIMPTDLAGGVLYDDIYLKAFPKLTYEDWADDNNLIGGDALRTADIENGGLGDGMENLLEYVLGGNPNVDDAASIMPVLQFPDAATAEYIYRRRNDAAARGLVYDLQAKGDLVVDPWTSTGGTFETGTNAINAEFDMITNSTATTNPELFLNLEVTEN